MNNYYFEFQQICSPSKLGLLKHKPRITTWLQITLMGSFWYYSIKKFSTPLYSFLMFWESDKVFIFPREGHIILYSIKGMVETHLCFHRVKYVNIDKLCMTIVYQDIGLMKKMFLVLNDVTWKKQIQSHLIRILHGEMTRGKKIQESNYTLNLMMPPYWVQWVILIWTYL